MLPTLARRFLSREVRKSTTRIGSGLAAARLRGETPPPDASMGVPHDPQAPHGIDSAISFLETDQVSSQKVVLSQPQLVVTRQVEWMNVFAGFEQANRYAIQNSYGQTVGYILEENRSLLNVLARQFLALHRKFNATVIDVHGRPLYTIRRPYYLINSRTEIYDHSQRLVGEVVQDWHLWRRRYDLFVEKKQFGRIDSGFLSMSFLVENRRGESTALIDRHFGGLAREMFTDTGMYVVHYEHAPGQTIVPAPDITLGSLTQDQRAVVLATAIGVDFDYFSRHSRGGIGILPFFFVFGGELVASLQLALPAGVFASSAVGALLIPRIVSRLTSGAAAVVGVAVHDAMMPLVIMILLIAAMMVAEALRNHVNKARAIERKPVNIFEVDDEEGDGEADVEGAVAALREHGKDDGEHVIPDNHPAMLAAESFVRDFLLEADDDDLEEASREPDRDDADSALGRRR